MRRQKIFNLDEFRKKEKPPSGLEAPGHRQAAAKTYLAVIVAGFLKDQKWLLAGLFLLIVICLLPTPDGLSVKGKYALGLWAFVIVCFLTEAVPLPLIAMIIGFYQVLMGIGNFHEVPRTFMDDAVIFIMGVLMIGSMLVRYNIHNKIALFMLKVSGTRIDRVILGIVAFCALSAGFITEHATVTIMMPIGIGIVSLSGGFDRVPRLSKLLMLAISNGVIIGGVASPSGGARNALMMGFLNSLGITVGYGQWMLMAMPLTIVMIPVVTFWLLKIFKPEVADLGDVMETIKAGMDAGGPMTGQARAITGIFLAVLFGWVFFSEELGVGTIAMIGIVLAAVFRLVDWNYLQQRTPWGVVLLYAGAISMGRMLASTGAAAWLAKQVLAGAAAFGIAAGLPLLSIAAGVTALTTNTMADGPTVAVLGPIFLKVAELAETSPLAVGVATSLSSAFAYLLVIGTPANAIVYGSGFLKAADFLKAGLLFFLLSLAVVVFLLAGFWWRILGVW
ncbi:MAG: DASS family sodium-coupled anion symporter [Peptococcaceae bacterium]|nr:MAG: DASS family sodium-coupled anion symporter [Peptococcaceae bacterium]